RGLGARPDAARAAPLLSGARHPRRALLHRARRGVLGSAADAGAGRADARAVRGGGLRGRASPPAHARAGAARDRGPALSRRRPRNARARDPRRVTVAPEAPDAMVGPTRRP